MRSDFSDPTTSPLLSARMRNLLLILACTLPVLAYHRSFGASFVYDDRFLIVGNTEIQSLDNWTAFFSQSMWSFVRNPTRVYYRPLTVLFFSIEYRLFGDQPLGWHLVTVFLHVVVTYLVFWTGNAVLKNRTAALFAALLFGVYPIHTEVACWAVATNESLLAIAVLTACGGFVIGYEGRRRVIWFCVSLVCAAAALLIKETAAVLPLLLFWYAFIRGRSEARWGQRLLQASLHAAPYGVLYAAMLLIRSHVLHQSLAKQIPIKDIVTRFPWIVWLDVRQLLLPFRPSIFYNPGPTLSVGLGIGLTLLLGAVLVTLLVWSCRRRPIIAFLLFWTVISLLPSILVVTSYMQVQDRFLYLASVATCWAGGLLITWMACGPPRLRIYGVSAAAIVVVAFTISSFIAAGYWNNDMSLFQRAAQIAPRNAAALSAYAEELVSRGRKEEGLAVLHRALALDPSYWMALYRAGRVEMSLGDLNGAEEHLARAEKSPDGSDMPQRTITHTLRASIAIRRKEWRKAEQLLREALAADPDNKMLRDELAYCLQNARQGNQGRQDALASQNARVRAAKIY